MIGGAGWRHHDVTGLNFYISGCDPCSRHHFLADGRCCAGGVSFFETLNPSRSQTCVLDFQKKVCLLYFLKLGFRLNVALYKL